jgi:hypothetical protein
MFENTSGIFKINFYKLLKSHIFKIDPSLKYILMLKIRSLLEKPLYYLLKKNNFIFASKILQI